MADELIDICDESMNPIGTTTKSEAHRRGYWHVAVHGWIVRPEPPGFVLFQEREVGVPTRQTLLDVTLPGHVASGEIAEEHAAEMIKTLGLDGDPSSLVPLGVKIELTRMGNEILIHEFCRTYLVTSDQKPHEYRLDHDEFEGLVEIAIPDGLELCSGRVPRVEAHGIDYDPDTAGWKRVEHEIGAAQLFPRVDPYFLKVFIMADRLLRGEHHLAI